MGRIIEGLARQEIAKAEAILKVSVTNSDVTIIDRIVARVNPRLRYQVQKQISRRRAAAGLSSNFMDWTIAYPEKELMSCR